MSDTPKLDIVDQKTEINQEVVDLLEKWLGMARSGALEHVTMIGLRHGEMFFSTSASIDKAKQLGLLVLAQHNVVGSLDPVDFDED